MSVSDFSLSHWRDKTHLVSPNAMHAHFRIGGLSYDGRKHATEAIAEPFVPAVAGRRHDVADALCLLLFWTQRIWRPPKEEPHVWMEKFGFKGFL